MINLKNNRIKKIQDYSFNDLYVDEINLENNNLSEINHKSFGKISIDYFPIRILNLKKNPIKYIDAEFFNSDMYANLIEFYLDNQTFLINNSIKTSYIVNYKLIKLNFSKYRINQFPYND